MGINKKKKLSSYWSTKPSQHMPYFANVMSQRFFILLSRMFHLNNPENEKKRGEEGYDPWFKLRPVLDRLNAAFKRHYVPSRHISIDESMIGMKNRCCFIQFMPNKRHARFGVKKFELCDKNGYICHVELYAGKEMDVDRNEGQAHGVVMKLMESCNLLNKGYHLFTDNFYTKPRLADTLFDQGTLLTGTVRANSKNYPKAIAQAKLQPGETLYARQGSKLAVAFREKKSRKQPVLLLSTFHPAVNMEKNIRGKVKTKPAMVFDYNSYMGGVDVSDKKLYHVAAERPTHRYWVKIFRNLLDIAILNAHELYLLNTDKDRQMNKEEFVISVLEHLCGAGEPQEPDQPLVPLHRLVLLPGKKERNCVVCSDLKGGIRRRSRHWCPGCDVGCHERCEPQLEHFKRIPQRGQKRRLDAADDH